METRGLAGAAGLRVRPLEGPGDRGSYATKGRAWWGNAWILESEVTMWGSGHSRTKDWRTGVPWSKLQRN